MSHIVVRSCVRRRLAYAVLGFVSVAALTFPPPAAAQATAYLSDKAMREAILGKTFASTSRSGKAYTMNLAADGTGLIAFGSGLKEPVTWNITGDVLCFKGPHENECDRIRPAGGKFDFVDSSTGTLNNTYTPQ
jgi:hypothetical protein